MSPAVNAGIVKCFSEGVLTSTSLLANAPAAPEAFAAWRALREDHVNGRLASAAWRRQLEREPFEFDLGIHLNLTQGKPLTADFPRRLLTGRGFFPGSFRQFGGLARARAGELEGIRRELEAQIAVMVDHGVRPSHLNGHHYLELYPGVSDLVPELMARFGIGVCRLADEDPGRFPLAPWQWPLWAAQKVKFGRARKLRERLRSAGLSSPELFRGSADAGRIDLRRMARYLDDPSQGQMEVGLHPGNPVDPTGTIPQGWGDALASRRPRELELLTSPALVELLLKTGVGLGRLAADV